MAGASAAGVNGGGMPLWLKKIFTTEDTEVHRDAQGEMKRTFYEEDLLGMLVWFPCSLRHPRCENKFNIAARPRCAPIFLAFC
jgi:hypothetical protein